MLVGFCYECNVLCNFGFEYDGGMVDFFDEEEVKFVVCFGFNYQAGKVIFLWVSWGQGYCYFIVVEKYIVIEVGVLCIVFNFIL